VVAESPNIVYFKPAGIPLRDLDEVCLLIDEFEAIRLKDLEGLDQEQGAVSMGVSRPTFQRILSSARHKIAQALVGGKALRIEGGRYRINDRINQQDSSDGKESIMKYAIPMAEGHLSQHFGQSSEFMLIDVDDKGLVTDKKVLRVEPHNCGGTPAILAKQGVKVVLAGGMGMGPRMAFERNNIQVVLGVSENDPDKAVLGHFKGTLGSGQNVCSHGDVPCDHTGHN